MNKIKNREFGNLNFENIIYNLLSIEVEKAKSESYNSRTDMVAQPQKEGRAD